MRCYLISVMLLAMLVVCNGCGKFGGHTVRVVLDSEPRGAEAYLIPQYEWDRHYDGRNLSRWFSRSYREGGTQVTPFQAYVRDIEQVYLVRKVDDGKKMCAWQDWVIPKEGERLYVKLREDCEE